MPTLNGSVVEAVPPLDELPNPARFASCAEQRSSRRPEVPAPQVSVVIPTRDRPLLVLRAVRSALNQNFSSIEVIVVVDGHDPETLAVLREIDDDRLYVLPLPANVGGSEARNTGVRRSRANWIAFLDDDDEWLPSKLKTQLAVAEAIGGDHVVVTSRFIERSETRDRVLPARPPRNEENFSEYLFARRGWKSGETFLQTSTWLVSRPLLKEVMFSSGLERCQDLDWLLHATALPTTRVVVIPEVLAIFHHGERIARVSRKSDWRFLYKWVTRNRSFMTRKSLAFFIATFCAPAAAKQQEGWKTFLFLLKECVAHGGAGPRCIALFLICWFLPEDRRRKLRFALDSITFQPAGGCFDLRPSPTRKAGH